MLFFCFVLDVLGPVNSKNNYFNSEYKNLNNNYLIYNSEKSLLF